MFPPVLENLQHYTNINLLHQTHPSIASDHLVMKTNIAANKEATRAYHERSNAKSSLLQLPTELRDAIYKLVLPNRLSEVILIRSRDKIIRPPILRVCRQIRRETAEIWYAKVIFTARLTDMPLALTWIKTLPGDAMALLRHLHLVTVVHCRCEDQTTNFGSTLLKSTRGTCVRLDDGPVCAPKWIEEDDEDEDDDWVTVDTDCPTFVEMNKKIDIARSGLGHCMVKTSIEREDLLALVKAFDVAQRGRLHICSGKGVRMRWRRWRYKMKCSVDQWSGLVRARFG